MGLKVSRRKGINVARVITKVVVAVILLYVGGTLMEEVGAVLENTSSPFYVGFKLIGWTVGTGTSEFGYDNCNHPDDNTTQIANCLTDATGLSGGILAVVGIIAVATIILEFVQFRLT